MKRIVIIVAAILLCIAAVVILAPKSQDGELPVDASIRAIPVDAAVIFRVHNWTSLARDLREEDPLWGALRQTDWGHFMNSVIRLLDTAQSLSPSLRKGLMAHDAYLSMHSIGKGDVTMLMSVLTDGELFQDDEANRLFAMLGWRRKSNRTYEGSKIIEYQNTLDAGESLFVANYRGLILLSYSMPLVEGALRAVQSEQTLIEDSSLVALLSNDEQRKPVSCAVKPKLFMPIASEQLKGQMADFASQKGRWASWIKLDLDCSADAIEANGFSRLNDKMRFESQVMEGQEAQPLEVQEVIPANCGLFFRWGFSNKERLLRNIEAQDAPGSGRLTDQYTLKQWHADLALLSDVCHGEVALAYVPSKQITGDSAWVVVMRAESINEAMAQLERRISSSKGDSVRGVITLSLDRTAEAKIYPSNRADLFWRPLGPPFPRNAAKYYTRVDRYVAFASNPAVLKMLHESFLRNQTMATGEAWKSMRQRMRAQDNFTLYAAPNAWLEWGGQVFSTSTLESIRESADLWSQLQYALMQVSASSDIVFYNLVLKQGNVRASGVLPEWASALKAGVRGRPTLMNSHVAKGKEILLQDSLNALCLLNAKGHILFRRPMDEPVLGEPISVDLLQNGKWQYVFTTPSAIWAIDRNGNPVRGFPIKLAAKATAPLAAFDYDKKRDYRFIVPTADRRLVVYDRHGRKVSGFQSPLFETEVTQQVKLLQSKGRDYLVVPDGNRMYVLNRRGNARISAAKLPNPSVKSDFDFAESGDRTSLMYVDATGQLVRVALPSGKVDQQRLEGWTPSTHVVVADCTDDSVPELISIDGKTITCSDINGNAVWSRSFDYSLEPAVKRFSFGAKDVRLGIVEPESGRIWLIMGSGEIAKGFPLQGQTLFSIGRLEKSNAPFNLVVGYNSSLLNYAVQ